MILTNEMIKKAKAANSVDELLALAAENGISITAEEAETVFSRLHTETEAEAVSDIELENVAGGSSCKGGKTYSSDPPHYLITTAWNSCKSCTINGKPANAYCKDCESCFRKGLTLYCEFRTKEFDIYN